MKRLLFVIVILALGLEIGSPVSARVRRVVVRREPLRTVVVVHPGFPIRRRLPLVTLRAARRAEAIATTTFLPVVAWTPVLVKLPEHERLAWEDSETLSRADDWTELTLNVDDRGTELYLELAGKVQLNFAEVVFENGATQVVDLGEKMRGEGIYSLLEFREGRSVSHVRMVARARSDQARVILRMEK